MTLNEAIAHCKEKAEELRKEKSKFAKIGRAQEWADCLRCAEEHEQLAAWLTELAEYQQLFESPKEAEEILNMLSV